MALYGNNQTATATVGANTNVVTIAGLDLALVTPGMTINFGARDRKAGDAWIISGVTPNGTNGGTLTTQGNVPTAYSSVPFVIDTTGYLGTDASYAAAVGLAILSTLATLLGVATNLYSGARQLVMDKASAAAVSRFVFSIAGRAWGAIEHRTLTYTPAGGQTVSVETLAARASPDGTAWTDALLLDLTNGTGDLRRGSVTMASANTVDLSSAPASRVAITGAAEIYGFGPGRNLDRDVRFVDAGAALIHNAVSLILPGGSNIIARAGDTLRATSDSAGNWRVHSYHRADGTALAGVPLHMQGRCRLDYISATQVRLIPFDGNLLFVGGTYRTIPNAGINMSNSGLLAGSLYYVYAYVAAGGVLTLEPSTVAPAADSTYGHQIKSGDATRTLVGMVYMDAGSPGTFADTATKRYVASYFNRQPKILTSFSAALGTSSTALVELNAAQRCSFLAWGDRPVDVSMIGTSYNSGAGGQCGSQVGIDGTGGGYPTYGISVSANATVPVAPRSVATPTRGLHFATMLGSVSGGTGGWQAGLIESIEL